MQGKTLPTVGRRVRLRRQRHVELRRVRGRLRRGRGVRAGRLRVPDAHHGLRRQVRRCQRGRRELRRVRARVRRGRGLHRGTCARVHAPTVDCGASCVDAAGTRRTAARAARLRRARCVQAGACVCPGAQRVCGGICTVDTDDPANCGACGRACGRARSARPARAAAPPDDAVRRGCAYTTSDPQNCGGCCKLRRRTGLRDGRLPDHLPGLDHQLRRGVRRSAAGRRELRRLRSRLLAGRAVLLRPLRLSHRNCAGAAGDVSTFVRTHRTVARAGGPARAARAARTGCALPVGPISCGGTCTFTATDPRNCGGCGIACGAGQICNGGRCGCPSGTSACGNACVDLSSASQNCGRCGNVCPPAPPARTASAPARTGSPPAPTLA